MGLLSKERSFISLILIAGINFLFAYKYLHRITEWSLILSCVYFSFLLLAFIIITGSNHKLIYSKSLFIGFIIIYSIAAFVLWSAVDINQLDVDRWSVISSFWESAAQGKYPYLATSHMGNHPGPLPVYFIITWPFYKLGELGLFTLSGLVLLSIFMYFKSTIQNANGCLLLLITSVAVIWELVTRSTILTNSILFLLGIHWFLELDFQNKKQYYLSSLVAALLLSTRTIFVIPLVIFGIYTLQSKRGDFKSLFGWAILIFLFFALTFIPIIIHYSADFWCINPFTVQSEQLLPVYFTPIIILFSVYFGWISKKSTDVIFFSGVGLLTVFLLYFIYVVANTSLYDAFFNSKADISYLLFSLPFFLYQFTISNKRAL